MRAPECSCSAHQYSSGAAQSLLALQSCLCTVCVPRLSRLPPGPRAFRLGAQHVDEMLLVDEKSIALAVLRLLVSGPCSQYSHGFSIR